MMRGRSCTRSLFSPAAESAGSRRYRAVPTAVMIIAMFPSLLITIFPAAVLKPRRWVLVVRRSFKLPTIITIIIIFLIPWSLVLLPSRSCRGLCIARLIICIINTRRVAPRSRSALCIVWPVRCIVSRRPVLSRLLPFPVRRGRAESRVNREGGAPCAEPVAPRPSSHACTAISRCA